MFRLISFFFPVFCLAITPAAFAAPADSEFSKYVLEAVERTYRDHGGLGYGDSALTHDLQFGDNGTIKASSAAPLTMCVAAQLEVLIQALNGYAQVTRDNAPFHFLPKGYWEKLRPRYLRGMIWQVENSNSSGFGYAVDQMGMGKRVAFKDLFPGAFVNFNRARSGHAGVFLNYLDKNGNELSAFSAQVAGFKYFSSQGMNKPKPISGMGYRYAFFSDVTCPATLPDGHLRDCGVLRSDRYLTGGYVLMPQDWNGDKANAAVLSNNNATDPILTTEGVFNANYFNGETTD
ncbi:hypothetical protein [Pararhizobium sp. DWP3-4]|uniref:hypothetical protein n=1 Tax=Pararhizobium sp. DWP3-4 TaxID=2804565 RepID=UPI003CF677AB